MLERGCNGTYDSLSEEGVMGTLYSGKGMEKQGWLLALLWVLLGEFSPSSARLWCVDCTVERKGTRVQL